MDKRLCGACPLGCVLLTICNDGPRCLAGHSIDWDKWYMCRSDAGADGARPGVMIDPNDATVLTASRACTMTLGTSCGEPVRSPVAHGPTGLKFSHGAPAAPTGPDSAPWRPPALGAVVTARGLGVFRRIRGWDFHTADLCAALALRAPAAPLRGTLWPP